MDLLEYQGKQLFRKHSVPTPEGRHATSLAEAAEAEMDVEEVAEKDPEAMRMLHVDPLLAEANLPNVHTEATTLGAAERVVELA